MFQFLGLELFLEAEAGVNKRETNPQPRTNPHRTYAVGPRGEEALAAVAAHHTAVLLADGEPLELHSNIVTTHPQRLTHPSAKHKRALLAAAQPIQQLQKNLQAQPL